MILFGSWLPSVHVMGERSGSGVGLRTLDPNSDPVLRC